MHKIFIEPGKIWNSLGSDKKICIDGDRAHHLLHVLRVKPGDVLTVCDGANNDYSCVVVDVSRGCAVIWLQINESSLCNNEPQTRVTLYQALPKGDKMDLIIQKNVELGIHAITPVVTDHTEPKFIKRDRITRYRRISEAAAAQSMRGIIPVVNEVLSFGEAIIESSGYNCFMAAYENERNITIAKRLDESPNPKNIGIMIGPEGGFSDREALLFAPYTVTLSKRILRTETAGFAALMQIFIHLGDM